jgi:hypothetical protein
MFSVTGDPNMSWFSTKDFEDDWIESRRLMLQEWARRAILKSKPAVERKGEQAREILVYNWKGGLKNLIESFELMARTFCYAEAGETLAERREGDGSRREAGFWRYEIRDYHFYMFFPRFFALQDYAAFYVNDLSHQELCKDLRIRQTSFRKVKKELRRSLNQAEDVGPLGKTDRSKLLEFLRTMDLAREHEEAYRKARIFRDQVIHRRLPDVDRIWEDMSILPPLEERDPRTWRDIHEHGLPGLPKEKYAHLRTIALKVISLVDASFENLFSTDVLKACFENPQMSACTSPE